MSIGEDEFSALVERHQPAVFRWAVALLGDRDDAEDVTQEVFVRVHRKFGTFHGDGTIEGWLFRITRSRLLGPRTTCISRILVRVSTARTRWC